MSFIINSGSNIYFQNPSSITSSGSILISGSVIAISGSNAGNSIGMGLHVLTHSGGGGSQTLKLTDQFSSGSKFLRISGGTLQVLNTAFTSAVASISDAGNLALRNDSTGTGSFIFPLMPGKPLDTQFAFASDGQLILDKTENILWVRI